jgi:nonsense-mediated mRNA decay protein 3
VEEVPGGVDMLLSSISLSKMLAKEMSDSYGIEVKESSKLIGKAENGSDMYRMTYLLRMPEYRTGDVVMFEGMAHKLSGISKGTGKLTRLGDFRNLPIRRTQMAELKVHTSKNDLMKATVISKARGEIQILDPITYSTVDIRIPENDNIGDTVNIADIDDTLFYVP